MSTQIEDLPTDILLEIASDFTLPHIFNFLLASRLAGYLNDRPSP